jgi:uncharacterized protein
MKTILSVKGMHCNSCAQKIEDALEGRVVSVSVNYSKSIAKIEFESNKISLSRIKELINKAGYTAFEKKEKVVEKDESSNKVGLIVMISSIIILLAVLYNYLGNLNLDLGIPAIGEQSSLLLLFLVGILTGFHCVSMCGAFVVSYTAKNAINGHKGYHQHFIYATAKLFSYAIIGGIFGLIGGIISFSIGLRASVAIFAGVFMIFYALSMMGLTFFRRFQFNFKFLSKLTHKASKNAKGPYLAPFVTGLLSGLFIACGPLQAMYLYAMGTGSFFRGFSSLMAFGLGTLPVMIGFGSLATKISGKTTKRILKFSAILVLILGIIMLNRGLVLLGSPVSFETIKGQVIQSEVGQVEIVNGYQEISMKVDRSGWTPDTFTLKKGVPVRWEIDVEELTGCNNEIIVNDYDLDIKLKKGLNSVEFTPDESGTVQWSCWMGMIPGTFIVTDSGEASEKQIESSKPKASGTCGGSCGSSTCGGGSGGGCGCGG